MYTALRIRRCKGPHLANDCNPDIEIEGRYPLRLRVVHFLSVSFSAVKVCLSERKTLVDAYSCQSISTVCLSRRVRYRIDCRERIRITSGNHVFASSRFPVPFLHGGHHKCPIKKDNRTKRIIDFQFQHTLGSGVESGSNHLILLQLFSSSPIYLRYAWLMGKFSIPFFASRIARMMEGDENFRISNFNSFVSAFFTLPIRSSLSGTSRPFGTRTELELVRCS